MLLSMIQNAYELLAKLKSKNLLEHTADEFWWPKSGTYEVIIGAILTQQSKWESVEKSLANLHKADLSSLQDIANCDIELLKECIKPSGFYNQKSHRLKLLASNILQEFDFLEEFKNEVTREWLLSQKGIGFESADAILCYFAYRDVMVVDNYTKKMLKGFGYEFESYHQIQEWIEEGITQNFAKVQKLYGYDISLHKVYARLHGKIVEFSKKKSIF